jgi:TonB-linked SusC/RagA family outer membrane protein
MVHPVVRALRRFLRPLTGTALGLAVLGAADVVAQAQPGTVSGTVSDSKTGRPLADARVSVENGDQAARSGTRGEFRLTGLTGATVRLRITRIGYQAATAEAPVGGAPVDIKLTEMVVKLDELVVTGTAGDAQKRTLGNAVGNINVASTLAVTGPPAKIQDLLSVNVPGVRVIRASGAIGTGGTTRIRGSGSLSLSNEPLVYVDGVRVNNQAAVQSLGFGGQESPSRVNDLNPEEIESIEVLKGPSAATIFGTEASNGVIQIITKRGKAGRPTIEAHMDGGVNWLMDPKGRYESNYYVGRTDGKIHEFNVQRFREARGFPDIFSNGYPIAFGSSISGGTDALRYFFSLDGARDEGPVTYNWQNKYSGRANLSYTTADDKFKVDLSYGSIRSRTRGASGVQPITTSILWACNFPWCEPTGDTTRTGWNGPGNGFQFYRPEDYNSVFGFDNIDRTMLSIQLSHRPTGWLRHRLVVGPDFTNNKSSRLVYRDGTGYNPFFATSLGLKQALQLRSTFLTVDYGASADLTIGRNLVAQTAAGVQYYYKQFDRVFGEGAEFAIPGPSDISGGARITSNETFLENKNFGMYVQEQLSWKNRLFLTGAVRADDNSAFGANFDAVYYPKVSLSWVVSEEPFLTGSGLISQLKLRGAWGRAGLQPDVFSAIQTYQPAIGSSGLGGVTPQNFGNPDLKPEIGEEVELGFDAGLFDQRLGIEFTFYNKDIKDAIISAPLKPSRGFPGVQFLNIGKTRNRGFELALDGTLLNGRNLGLDLRGTIATNDSKILDLGGVPPTFVGASFIQQFNVEGYAPQSFFYKRVVSSTLTTTQVGPWTLPLATNPMCEGGTDLGDGNGTVVPCAQAPRIYRGRPTPSWNGSLSATLRVGQSLQFLTLVDYLGGGTAVVGDVGAVHTFFRNSRRSLEGDPILEGYRLDPNGPGATGVFKIGFAKLRTVAATYTLPNRVTRWIGASRGSVTVAGENLATLWREQKESFGVRWIDPEILPNRVTDVTGNFGYTQESWPQLARVRVTARVTF